MNLSWLFVFQVWAVAMQELDQLSSSFKALKERKGHWDGQEYDEEIDSFESTKHLVMQELGEKLIGSDGSLVLKLMGKPDEITTPVGVLPTMPGPFISGQTASQNSGEVMVWIYYWRFKHDYLQFFISQDEKVVSSSWYHAGE
jgi:hypothetical protein